MRDYVERLLREYLTSFGRCVALFRRGPNNPKKQYPQATRGHTHQETRKKKAKKAQREHTRAKDEFLDTFRRQKSAIRSPPASVSNIPPRYDKMSASPASYNVTLATLRTTSPSRNKSRKQVRQQTEKEKRRARLLKKLEIVALRERGFAAHNVRFLKPTLSISLFKINSFKTQFLMSHKVHLVARLNVIATNFGYFGLSYVMLMRLVEISSGASSSIGVIIAFFLSYLFEVLKYSFLKEKKKEKRTVEIQKYEYKKYVIHTCVWIRSDGTLTISLEDERTFD
jgi:hypothetical protein